MILSLWTSISVFLRRRRVGDRPAKQRPEVGPGSQWGEAGVFLQPATVHGAGGNGPPERGHGAIGISLDPGGERAGPEGPEQLGGLAQNRS